MPDPQDAQVPAGVAVANVNLDQEDAIVAGCRMCVTVTPAEDDSFTLSSTIPSTMASTTEPG